jgi:hypothetical protein
MSDDQEIEQSIASGATTESGYAIAYAILKLADACRSMATQLKYLGTGDAGTTMGAIEYLATEVRDGMQSISTEIREGIEFVSAVKTQ